MHPLPPPYISTRRRDGRQQDGIRQGQNWRRATGDDNDDGDGATGDNDGNGTMDDDDDDDGDSATGDGATGYDDDDDGDG